MGWKVERAHYITEKDEFMLRGYLRLHNVAQLPNPDIDAGCNKLDAKLWLGVEPAIVPIDGDGGLVLHERVPHERELSNLRSDLNLVKAGVSDAGTVYSVVFLSEACDDRLDMRRSVGIVSLCK